MSFWSVSPFACGIECHIVISTGFFAFFSAASGQLSAAAAGPAPATATRLAPAITAATARPANRSELRFMALPFDVESGPILV